MINKYGFIYFSPGSDPHKDRTVTRTGGMTTILVPVPDVDLAPAIACALVAEDVDLIELCGIFGPVGAARVLAATEHRVPVGFVSYGVESASLLVRLIAS